MIGYGLCRGIVGDMGRGKVKGQEQGMGKVEGHGQGQCWGMGRGSAGA